MSTFNPVQYVKNVTRSVGYVAKESLKELNPTIAEFADTNNDTIREMYSAARDFKKNAKSGAQRLAENEYAKIGKEAMLNFFDDLRTGNFYNKERAENSAAAAAGINFDDDWDIDVEVNFGEDDDSNTLTMSGMDEIGSKISQANAKATILSADYIVKANKATTKSMMAHNEMMFGKVQTSIAGVNSTIASIGQSSLKAASAHYENSTKFYDFMTNQTAEQTGYMKQIYELLNARFNPKRTERSFGKNAYRDIVGFNGAPDLAAWGKNIKANFDDMMGLYTSIGGMFTPDMVRHMFSSPISSLMKMGTVGVGKKLFGKDLEKFNQTLGGLFGSTMLKLNRKASADPYSITGMIASLLGIEPSKTKTINTSKYDKGRTDWTGKDAKALREVIPTQLAQILAALTGKDAKIFDYERGRWVSYSNMQDNLKKDVKDIVNRNTTDIREQFEKYFLEDYANKGITKNSKAYRTYQADQSNFFRYLTMNNSRIPLNETQWNNLETQMKRMKLFVDASNPNGIMLYTNFRKIRSYYRRNANNGLGHLNMQANGNMINARNEIGNFYERQSTDPSSQYGMLFNGSGLGSTGKNASETSLLNITIDDKGNNLFFYLQNFYSDLKKIADNTAGGGGNGGGRPGQNRSRRRRRQQENNYDVPTNLSENPNNPTQRNRREFVDVDDDGSADNDIYHREKRKTREEEAKDALESKFKNSKIYKLLGKHGDAFTSFFNLPIKTVRGAIDAADKRMYQLIYGKDESSDENEERGILDKILEGFDNTFASIKKSAKKFLKETVHPFFAAVGDKIANWFGYDTFKDMKDKAIQGIKNSKFVQGVKENLKSAGRWVKNSVRDTVYETGDYFTDGKFSKGMDNLFGKVKQFGSDMRNKFKNQSGPTPEAPQAARGGMVTKSGMISVSEGEMIIPSHKNPYYNGHKSTSSQLTSERGVARKWKAMTGAGSDEYWGEYAEGGTAGSHRGKRVNRSAIRGVHRGYQRVKKFVVNGAERASEIFEDTRDDVESIMDDVRQTDGYKKTSAAFDWATKVIKNGAMSIVNRLFGSNVDEDGNVDDGKSSKEKMAKTMKTAFGEVKKYAPTVAAGGIIGGAASLVGGFIGGPLVGAGLGAAVALATKSEKFQNYLFGEIDEKGNRKGGFFGPKFSNFLTKRFPRLAKFGATGGLMGLTGLIPGGPIAGLMVGSAMGFITESDRLHDYLFGEEGLLGKDTDKKLKKSLPKAALGAAIGAFTGPFGLVGNMMLGGAIGFASDTDKFREMIFGTPDSNGELQGGILGIVRDDVIDPMKNYFKGGMKKFEDYMVTYIFDPVKEFLRPAGDLIGAAIQNTFDNIGAFIKKEFTDKVGTPIMKFLQSKFFKPISNAVGWLGKNAIKIAAAPGKLFGKTLNAATRKLDRKAISKGYSSLSAEDRALAATTDRRLGGMNYATKEYDSVAAGMSAEELEEAKKDLDLYRNTKRGQKLDKKKMRADSIKQILADSEWGTTLKEDKRIKRAMDATIKSGNFDSIYEVVRQMDKKGQFNGKTDKLMAFLQEREQKIKDIDNTDISDIENRAKDVASKLGIDIDTYYNDKNLRRLMAGDIRHKKKDSEPAEGESKHKVLDPNKKTTMEYAVDRAVDYLKDIRDAIVKVAGGEAPTRRYETGNIFGRGPKIKRRLFGGNDNAETNTDDCEAAQAARGGMVTKSGMISVSEGEMIIPSERNPYYHGITNKRQQILNERTVANKYKAMGGSGYLGSYAKGGIVGNLMGAVKEIAHTPIDMYRDAKSAFGSMNDQLRMDGASPSSLIKSEFSKSTGYLAGIQAALFKMAGIDMKQEQDKDTTIAKMQRNVSSAISRAKSKLFGGNSEEDTKIEVDSEGNAIRYVKDAQGNWSPDVRDSGTKAALDNAKKSKSMKEKIVSSLTGLPGIFGGLFTKFFGKEDDGKEKKGILGTLLEKAGGLLGKVGSFFTSTGVGQAALGIGGLITGASILNWLNETNPELIPKIKEKLDGVYTSVKTKIEEWWSENKDGIKDFFVGGIKFIVGGIRDALPQNMDEWFQFFLNSGKRAKDTYDGIEDFLTGHDSSKYEEGEYERDHLTDRFIKQGIIKNSLLKGQTGNAILKHIPFVGKSANMVLSGVGHARNAAVDAAPKVVKGIGKGFSAIGNGVKSLVGKTSFGAKLLEDMGTGKALKEAASRFVGEGVDSKQFKEVMQSFIMNGMGADEAAELAAQNFGGELLEKGAKKPGAIGKFASKIGTSIKGSKVGGKVVDVISNASTKATNAVSTFGSKIASTSAGGKAVELVTKLKTMVASCLSKVMKLLGKSSDEIVEKGAKELAEAAVQEGGEKAVAGSLAKAAALPIQIGFIAAAVENGWEDAKSILGILDEPTLAQRAIAAAVNGCNEAIPGIGGIIPTEIIFSVLLNVFNALGIVDGNALLQQRAEANAIVDEYNAENNKTYNVREYVKNVLGEYTTQEKIGNTLKKAGGAVVKGVKSIGKGAKELGSKAVSGVKKLGGSVVSGVKSLGKGAADLGKKAWNGAKDLGSKAVDKVKDLGKGAVDLVKGAGQKIMDVAGYVKEVKTSFTTLQQKMFEAFTSAESNPVDAAMAVELDGISEDNPLAGFANSLSGIVKVATVPMIFVKQIGTGIKNRIIMPAVNTVKSTAASLVQNEVTASKLMLKGDVQGLLNAKAGEGTDDSNPIGWLTNVDMFIRKVTHIAPTAISWLGHKIVEKFNEYKGTMASTGAAMIQNRVQALKFMAAGDVQGLLNMKGGEGIGEDDPIGWINGVSAFVNKVSYIAPTAISWVGHKIVEKFNEYKGTIVSTGAALVQNRLNALQHMAAGDIQGLLNMEAGEGIGEDNPIGWINGVSNFVNKIIYAIPTGISWVGHKIVEKFNEYKGTMISTAASLAQSSIAAKGFMLAGDINGLLNMEPGEGAGEDNPIGWIASVGNFANKITHAVPTAISWVGHKVVEGFKSAADGAKKVITIAGMSQSNAKKYADAGDPSGLWSMNSAEGAEGPFGFIVGTSDFIAKATNTVPAVFGMLSNKLKESFKSGKIADVVGLVKNIWSYTDPKKDISGLDKLIDAAKSKDSGFMAGVTNLAVTIGGGITKAIVFALRPINQIIDTASDFLSDPIGAVKKLLNKAGEKANEYASSDSSSSSTSTQSGAGSGVHVSQKDPTFAGSKFGKKTIGEIGCGPAVAATVLRTYGKNGDLGTTANYAKAGGYVAGDSGMGTRSDYFRDILGQNGINSSYSDNKSAIRKAIGSGSPTILLGQDKSNTSKSNSPFGPNPHYVVAQGMDRNGNVVVDDPELGGTALYRNNILKNAKLGIMTGGDSDLVSNSSSNTIDGNTPQAKVYQFYTQAGISPAATAGIMGNIQNESGFKSDIIQGNGKGPAAGLFQWENYNKKSKRWAEMNKYAQSKGKPWTDLQSQMEYGLMEMNTEKWMWEIPAIKSLTHVSSFEEFKKMTNPADAAIAFSNHFERPGKPHNERRVADANKFYEQFTGAKITNPTTFNADGSTSTGFGTQEAGSASSGGGLSSAIDSILNAGFNAAFGKMGKLGELFKKFWNSSDSSSSSGSSSDSSVSSSGIGTSSVPAGTFEGKTEQEKKIMEVAKEVSGYGMSYKMTRPVNIKPGGFGDCSSTVAHILQNSIGVNPGGNTAAQLDTGKMVLEKNPGVQGVDESKLRPGDLLLYQRLGDYTKGRKKRVGHVEMYIGGGKRLGHGGGIGPKITDIQAGDSANLIQVNRYTSDVGAGSGLMLHDFTKLNENTRPDRKSIVSRDVTRSANRTAVNNIANRIHAVGGDSGMGNSATTEVLTKSMEYLKIIAQNTANNVALKQIVEIITQMANVIGSSNSGTITQATVSQATQRENVDHEMQDIMAKLKQLSTAV